MSVARLREMKLKYGIGDQGDIHAEKIDRGMPLDGSLYATNEYLKMIQDNDSVYYAHYVRHLQYFTGMYKFEGDEDIERLSPDIIRQVIEFGTVCLTKVKGRLAALAVITPEYNIYKELVKVECITLREGYGYNKKQKSTKKKGKDVVVLKQNYQALPFIFFWRKVIRNMMKLEKAAITGSVASIKKFKRNLQNNDSQIARIETESMMNPSTPYINNIVTPSTYEEELERVVVGDKPAVEKANTTAPNSIDFNTLDSSAEGQWENLKEYINYEYFQNGRRTNTNKKNERNLEGEINTEVINFDILEAEFRNYLDEFVKEVNKKLKCKIKLVSIMDEKEISKGIVSNQEGGENKGGGKKITSLFGKKDKNAKV